MPQVNTIEITDGKHDGSWNGTQMTAEDAHDLGANKTLNYNGLRHPPDT